ncbi:MAG: DUF1841 family protein [Betaproteobacteria bacterium]|nr:MAG: DUF1841 family protein [Betaproteobacteria bacterium]
MFAPSRDQARRFLFDTWHKYRAGEALSALERVALDVITLHPEYHALLDNPERNSDRDYSPELGQINPFLHLHLHLAVEEQLSIDQPPGIRAEYERLRDARGDPHAAKHALLECLGEVLWQSQRSATALDAAQYLECLRRRA